MNKHELICRSFQSFWEHELSSCCIHEPQRIRKDWHHLSLWVTLTSNESLPHQNLLQRIWRRAEARSPLKSTIITWKADHLAKVGQSYEGLLEAIDVDLCRNGFLFWNLFCGEEELDEMVHVFDVSEDDLLWNLIKGLTLVPSLDIVKSIGKLTVVWGWIKDLKLLDAAQTFFTRPFEAEVIFLLSLWFSSNKVKRVIFELDDEARWLWSTFEEAGDTSILLIVQWWSREKDCSRARDDLEMVWAADCEFQGIQWCSIRAPVLRWLVSLDRAGFCTFTEFDFFTRSCLNIHEFYRVVCAFEEQDVVILTGLWSGAYSAEGLDLLESAEINHWILRACFVVLYTKV